MTGLSVNPLAYKDAAPPGPKCAWVVFLLTSPSYLPGILVLAHSLKKVRSKYPLIVAVNPSLPQATRDVIEEAGLEVRVVEPLLPSGKVTLIAERFADTWTKLALFDFVEYDRLVLIDGDMMVRQNMDELFNIPLQKDQIACNFACVCNLDESSWAPKDWTRDNCGYTPSHHPTALTNPGPAAFNTPHTHTLLNSGLVVLTPSHTTSEKITRLLTSSAKEDQEKIFSWMFPDQDLLADLFRGKWVSLPWAYNALKTMRYWHGNFFRDEDVRNLHYICDKPWQRRPERNEEDVRQETGIVYKVDAGDFEDIKDKVLGIPAQQADAITHGWWWEEYENMVEEMKESGFTRLDYLEGLVA